MMNISACNTSTSLCSDSDFMHSLVLDKTCTAPKTYFDLHLQTLFKFIKAPQSNVSRSSIANIINQLNNTHVHTRTRTHITKETDNVNIYIDQVIFYMYCCVKINSKDMEEWTCTMNESKNSITQNNGPSEVNSDTLCHFYYDLVFFCGLPETGL